jgi:inner membrane transporter RhtA
MGIVVAIFSSALPYSLEMYSLKRIPAKTFGILMSLEPVAASLIGLFFLNQELSHLQWGAILCVIVASLGTTLTN